MSNKMNDKQSDNQSDKVDEDKVDEDKVDEDKVDEDKVDDKDAEEEIECVCGYVSFNISNQKRYGKNLNRLTDSIVPKPKPRPKSLYVGSDVYRELGFLPEDLKEE